MEQINIILRICFVLCLLLTVGAVRLPQKQIYSCKCDHHTTETTLQAVRQEPSLHIADYLSPLKILTIKAAGPTNTNIPYDLLLLTDATFFINLDTMHFPLRVN